MLEEKWRVGMLADLVLSRGEQSIRRFRTQKTGELLAYLALNLDRAVSREELADRIWAESDRNAGRASLRTALASLRRLLEPPGTPANSVLAAGRAAARLQPDAVTTDVAAFDHACRVSQQLPPHERVSAGMEALRLYAGELLPNCYSDWASPVRERLSQAHLHLLRRVIAGLWKRGDRDSALDYARRLIHADPLREEAHLLTMRLYAASGRATDALRCFHNWQRLLYEELGEQPSPAVLSLARRIAMASGKTLGAIPTGARSLRPEETRSAANMDSLPLIPMEAADITHYPADTLSLSDAEAVTITPACDETRSGAPAKTLPTVRLPLTLTRCFGRETEIVEVSRLFDPPAGRYSAGVDQTPARLVTLTGPGGAGKTRLAIEAGRRLAGQSNRSVTFVSLADIREPERLLESIALALRLPAAQERLSEAVAAALSGPNHLLVLDNFEQLLADGAPDRSEEEDTQRRSAAEILIDLMEAVPSLCFLVTSRQCLDINGEKEYPVRPLSTPAMSGTPERLMEFDSVQLFVDRAQAARPDFQLTRRNADAVGALCVRLDGLPLALELAAAWSSVLSPSQILERMSHRFDLLISRRRGRLSRHHTLRAAIDWGFDLLSPDLQALFLRLSVFSGSWTAEAAEAICGVGEPFGGRAEPIATLEQLRALRDRSLVVVDNPDFGEPDEVRFHLLESLREFAEERLTPDERTALRRRHLEWYVRWSECAAPHLMGTEQVRWLNRAAAEHVNIRAALQYALEGAETVGHGLRIVAWLTQYWCLRGNYQETRALVDRFLTHPGALDPTKARATCLILAGTLAYYQKDFEAAWRFNEEAESVARQVADWSQAATALACQSNIAVINGDLEGARHYSEEAMRLYESAGNVIGVAAMIGGLGYLEMKAGQFRNALHYYLQTVALQRHARNLSGVTHNLLQLGIAYARVGDSSKTAECLIESMEGYRSLRDTRGLAGLFSMIAELYPVSESAVRLLGAAQTMTAATSAAALSVDEAVERARAELGDESFEAAWGQGCALPIEQAIAEAQILVISCRVAPTPVPTRS